MFTPERKLVLVVAVFVLTGLGAIIVKAGTPQGAEYVGPGKCKICHREQHKSWSETKHAIAFDSLLPSEQSKEDCVRCHVTGYGKEGGFVSADETPKLKHVTCEACHGAGEAHVKEAAKHMGQSGGWDTKVDRVPRNACIKCHNTHINQKERAEKLREKAGK